MFADVGRIRMPRIMDDPFKAGDTVQLITGSPTMAVSKYGGMESVECVWFEGTKQRTGTFSAATLKKVPPRSRGSRVVRVRGDF